MKREKSDFLSINYSLLASYDLLMKVSESKNYLEKFVDRFPDLVVFIRSDGTILRASNSFISIYGGEVEEIVKKDFFKIFQDQERLDFTAAVKKVTELNPDLKLECPIKGRLFFWHIRASAAIHLDGEPILEIIGRDIHLSRKVEKKLKLIFSTVPIGILLIDAKGTISEYHSAYAEKILKTSRLLGLNIHDVFEHGGLLNAAESPFPRLMEAMACKNTDWETTLQALPREVRFGSKCLSLSYSPFIVSGEPNKCFIAFDDISHLKSTNFSNVMHSKDSQIISDKIVKSLDLDPEWVYWQIIEIRADISLLFQVVRTTELVKEGSELAMPNSLIAKVLVRLKGKASSLGFDEIESHINSMLNSLIEIEGT